MLSYAAPCLPCLSVCAILSLHLVLSPQPLTQTLPSEQSPFLVLSLTHVLGSLTPSQRWGAVRGHLVVTTLLPRTGQRATVRGESR